MKSQTSELKVIRVNEESVPGKVAGCIAKSIRERNFRESLDMEVHAMGDRAAFITMKALAKAQTFLATERPDLYLAFNIRPDIVEVDGWRTTGYKFTVGWLAGM